VFKLREFSLMNHLHLLRAIVFKKLERKKKTFLTVELESEEKRWNIIMLNQETGRLRKVSVECFRLSLLSEGMVFFFCLCFSLFCLSGFIVGCFRL